MLCILRKIYVDLWTTANFLDKKWYHSYTGYIYLLVAVLWRLWRRLRPLASSPGAGPGRHLARPTFRALHSIHTVCSSLHHGSVTKVYVSLINLKFWIWHNFTRKSRNPQVLVININFIFIKYVMWLYNSET